MAGKGSRPRKKNPSDYDCDDYIRLLESQLPIVKQLRRQFSTSSIDANSYQTSMLQSITALQASVEGIRHTFVPLTIPQFLQVPSTPPRWISLSKDDQAAFEKFSRKNDIEQKELLVRFRKPGLRATGMSKTSQALAKQQEQIRDENEWQQLTFLASAYFTKLRPSIPECPTPPKGALQSVTAFFDSESLDIACDEESLEMLLLRLFDEEEGPLARGHSSSSILNEISEIAAVVHRFADGMTMAEVIGGVRTFVASLHRDALLKDAEKHAGRFMGPLSDAIDIFGERASMSDFGGEGMISPYVTEGLEELIGMTFVDQIAMKFHEVADLATEHGGGRAAGTKMLAAAIIAEKLTQIPCYLFLGIIWCSNEMFERFTTMGMYLRALDLLLGLMSDFNQ
jgi:hypothetical protein